MDPHHHESSITRKPTLMINTWLSLSDEQKAGLFNEAAAQKGLPAYAVEKDWWVTVTLNAIFTSKLAKHLIFKGGTSLSKAYNLIERFSEDIDLAVDRAYLGFSGELTKSGIKKLRKASGSFIISDFKDELASQLRNLGIPDTLYTLHTDENIDDTSDPHSIELIYKPVITQGSPYLQQRILIEIGARSLTEPTEMRPISSIVDETFPDQSFNIPLFEANVVLPSRTFLEKVFLLHEEFRKPTEKIRHQRLTRHLYDLERVMDHDFGLSAVQDKELFHTIVEFRQKYTAVRGITYDEHTHSTLSFLPPAEVDNAWRQDYAEMRENMFYGTTLNYDMLLERLQVLNERFKENGRL